MFLIFQNFKLWNKPTITITKNILKEVHYITWVFTHSWESFQCPAPNPKNVVTLSPHTQKDKVPGMALTVTKTPANERHHSPRAYHVAVLQADPTLQQFFHNVRVPFLWCRDQGCPVILEHTVTNITISKTKKQKSKGRKNKFNFTYQMVIPDWHDLTPLWTTLK